MNYDLFIKNFKETLLYNTSIATKKYIGKKYKEKFIPVRKQRLML